MASSSSPRPVHVRRSTVTLPTYLPKPPDRNPMFLEKRVYQGSSGRVYPLPFTDRIADRSRPRVWNTIIIENEYLLVTILPELGGRIHRILDKTNGFDAIYHQSVIKPALVGLTGPWASGGIEFNWPQHHRPSTFMPTDVAIEKHPDGSATVWLSEHDPMARMKGMHGVRLHAGRSVVELVARAYNRTTDVQTFLWWANVAIRVHEQYQSFFPPDATHIADHAKRATDTYPLSSGRYYGVDYATRAHTGLPLDELPRQFVPPHAGCSAHEVAAIGDRESKIKDALPAYPPNDLSWYANIPVPTSYMCTASDEDFCGGYDHQARAGLIHLANRHISPGKKQWTWGNHEFGYAWDRNLTEPDAHGEHAPYIELMAGVYTDNQPDFSYLQPGETKTWSQFWYPVREIGPAQHATLDAALSLRRTQGGGIHIGVAATCRQPGATIELLCSGRRLRRWIRTLAPDQPFTSDIKLPGRTSVENLSLRVTTAEGRELIAYTPKKPASQEAPAPATEPPTPADVVGSDELFIIGLHLEQYRHATRSPVDYWQEALRRDPSDSRAHLALGRWRLRRGELKEAEFHLRASIARLTSRNPNPYDGEAHYQLGRCLSQQALFESNPAEKLTAAYSAFYKATWNHAWQPAGYHALAELDARRDDWPAALDHLDRALRLNADNLRARNLRVVALRRLGRDRDASSALRETLALDPLDWWAKLLAGCPFDGGPSGKNHALDRRQASARPDVQILFDLALDHARAGLYAEALSLLTEARPVTKLHGDALPDASLGTAPLLSYYRAWLCHQLGDLGGGRRHLAAAAKASSDYCFPARLEEIAILRHAMAQNPRDGRAAFYLGNLLYDRRRHREAIALWEHSVRLEPGNAIAWRNLGIGCHNILHQPARALRAYQRAFRANPQDARLLFERDQLWKRLNFSPKRRLRELLRHRGLVEQRDDLSVELCSLFNQVGAPARALPIIGGRKFQPWEGGEGQALGQHVRTHLLLGRQHLSTAGSVRATGPKTRLAGKQPPSRKTTATAIAHFRAALTAPENLGEARHLLANQSDVHFWLGTALAVSGETDAARRHWTIAAEIKGDFQTMSIRPYSEMTYYSALALQKLGREQEAGKLLVGLLNYARKLAETPARIDYFATSLPTMLLFDDDLQTRRLTTALFLEAQARLALGQTAVARRILRTVLRRDPGHALASDLPV